MVVVLITLTQDIDHEITILFYLRNGRRLPSRLLSPSCPELGHGNLIQEAAVSCQKGKKILHFPEDLGKNWNTLYKSSQFVTFSS